MKAVILAGGLGTRLSEETGTRPKPMVEIGGKPILWHIMKIYSRYGIDEFVICLGYKGYFIKEYFSNYFRHNCDLTFDLGANTQTIHRAGSENWKVTLIDTGDNTLTGGRLKRVLPYVKDEEAFCLTYGDGVADVDISSVIALHRNEKRLATVTAVQPPGRFGALRIEGNHVTGFREKPEGDGGWINGGFFVCSPKVIDYIDGDLTTWEQAPLERLAHENQLSVHRHDGFWQPMDSLRDKNLLEELWNSGKAPWKVW
ncbi:MAG: glucose-1-phosphate cytidylyltransferase [Pseudomonadota bacterium]